MHGFGRKDTARPFLTSMAGGGARVGGDDGYGTKSSERTEGKRRGAHFESAGVVSGLGEAARRARGRRRSRGRSLKTMKKAVMQCVRRSLALHR